MGSGRRRGWRRTLLVLGLASLAGCQGAGSKGTRPRSILGDSATNAPLSSEQVADVQIAIGRTAENAATSIRRSPPIKKP